MIIKRLYGRRKGPLLFQTSFSNFSRCRAPEAGLRRGYVHPVNGFRVTPQKQQWGWVARKDL